MSTPGNVVKPGHWTNFQGSHIPDPPAGTYIRTSGRAQNNTFYTGWSCPSLDTFPTSKDPAVWKWIQLYTGQSKPNGFDSAPNHQTVIQLYNQLLETAPKAQGVASPVGNNQPSPLPDPGKAVPSGVIPTPSFGSILDVLKAVASALLDPNFWLRLGEGALGIILLAVGLAKLSGAENLVSKVVK